MAYRSNVDKRHISPFVRPERAIVLRLDLAFLIRLSLELQSGAIARCLPVSW